MDNNLNYHKQDNTTEPELELLVQKRVVEQPVPVWAKMLKWAALCLLIAVAAAAVVVSVLYNRFVFGENGRWVIDLTGRETVEQEQLDWLAEKFPDAEVRYDIDLGGLRVENTVTSLTLTDRQGVTADGLLAAAEQLPGLKTINLVGLSVSTEQYDAIRLAWPDAVVTWTVPVAGGLSPDTVEMNLDDMETLRQIAGAKKYLPKLARIYMNGDALSPAEVRELAAQSGSYGFQVIWNVTVAGQTLPYDTTSLTLSGSHITDLTELYSLPMLAQLTLDGIGTGDLSPLVSITTLEGITVRNMNVDGIEVLGQMHWLGAFYSKNTNLTYGQLNALQRQLPECIIMMIE